MRFSRQRPFFLLLFLPCLALFFAAVSQAGSGKPAQYPVAMRSFGVWEPATGERFDFSVWYPGAGGALQPANEKEGWQVSISRRGRVIPGLYPVILVSHDTASSRYANNDLASALASGGYMVIVPSHNGDSQTNAIDTYSGAMFRTRPRQLLRAMETLLENPEFSYYIDESRIGLLGVGFGSVTVLQLAGASPTLSGIEAYCAQGETNDAFCQEWPLQRLKLAAREITAKAGRQRGESLTPPLTLYAPKLTPAKLSREVLALFENQKEPEDKRPQTVWHNLFGDEKEEDLPQAKTEGQSQTDSAAAEGTEPFPLELDFQGGPLFGGSTSGSPYIHLAMPDSPEFRAGVGESPSNIMESPVSPEAEPDASTVYRRPPESRRILGVALMSPAGGMLFSQESLSAVRAPVVMVQAGKNEIYPIKGHAQPYYSWLPAPPLVLRLDGADHFSLFAPCSDENRENLDELCGRMDEADRESAAFERNRFLLNFFQTSVGVPLAPTLPPGFIAAQNKQQQQPQ